MDASFFCLVPKRVRGLRVKRLGPTHRLHSSSFLGLLYRILKYEPQKGTTMEPLSKGLSLGLAFMVVGV